MNVARGYHLWLRPLLACVLIIFVFSCRPSLHKSLAITPQQSVTAAIAQLQPGDTLFLRAGIYRQWVKILNSGEEALPIVIKAFPGEKAELNGTREITNWTKIKSNYYKAYCPQEVQQLFFKRKMLLPARWPNIDSMFDKKGWVDIFTGRDSVVFKGQQWPKNYWNGASCYALAGQKWVVNMQSVQSCNDSVLKMKSKWFNHRSGWYTGNGKGYMMKHLNALDTINEWHWQNDTVYVMLAEEPKVLEGQVRELVLSADSVSNVRIKDISIFAGRAEFNNCRAVVLDHVNISYGTYPKPYSYSNGASAAALRFAGTSAHCQIRNSKIIGNWSSGVFMEGDANEVYNCVVSNCNWTGNGSSAIATEGKNHVIMNCDLFNSGKFLVEHGYTAHIKILYNHIYNGGYLANDLGLTYAYRTRGEGSEIAYNWMHGNWAESAGAGIYIDIDGHDFLIHHNVVWDCLSGIQTIMNAYDHQIYNNTVWNCTKAINYWGPYGSNMYNQKVYNNLSDKPFNAGTDLRNNLCVSDWPTVDNKNRNFTLRKGSAAIDFGGYVEGITNHYCGAQPDAGAYEFGMPAWVPGYDSTCVYAD